MSRACTAAAALVLAFAAASCGGAEGESGPAAAGVVRGTLRYDGARTGPVRVAVFGSFPPRGLPIAQLVVPEPQFPLEYAVEGVPQGRWFVLAIVDTDPADGERFHPTVDPGGAHGELWPSGVTLDPGAGAAGVDITLAEPSEGSPWARGSYR